MNSNFHIPQTTQARNSIRCIWQTEGYTQFKSETIIPKGIIEIIFDLANSAPIYAKLDNKEYQCPKCFINGFNTSPINLQLPAKHSYFGVQFNPGAIKTIFGFLPSEFSNRTIDLTLINASFHSLYHQLGEKNSFNERVAVISDWIRKKTFNVDAQSQLLNQFLCKVDGSATTVTALSKTLCYSARHLARKIYDLTGMNTEELLFYRKYLRSIDLMHHTELSLTEIAYLSHFADQSHFIKSFKAFAQISPGQYRQIKSQLPGHIYENVR